MQATVARKMGLQFLNANPIFKDIFQDIKLNAERLSVTYLYSNFPWSRQKRELNKKVDFIIASNRNSCDDNEFKVSPCDSCIDTEKQDAYNSGQADGHEEGYNEALKEMEAKTN